MTGRGAGYCSGLDRPGFMQAGFGRGLGLGRGFRGGRGIGMRGFRCHPWAAPAAFFRPWYSQAESMPGRPSPQQESRMLQNQIEELEATLDELKQRRLELDRERSGSE